MDAARSIAHCEPLFVKCGEGKRREVNFDPCHLVTRFSLPQPHGVVVRT